MNRCIPPAHRKPAPPSRGPRQLARQLGWAACALLSLSAAAQSEEGRQFPANALRGTLTVTQPPAVLLDGQPDQLSPGARIRDADNRLLMSASLVGQPVLVNFTREAHGLIHEVWLITAQEALQKTRPATAARNFQFSSEVSTVPRDDGKTPFHLLPRFPQR